MSAYQPRRPAQLKPDQIELIEGGSDIAEASELAHTTASVIVPIGGVGELDEDVRARVLDVIADEGVDPLAESWVASPPESLPGILWRGYLLREWIRRFPHESEERFAAAKAAEVVDSEGLELILHPLDIQEGWDEVLAGDFQGDFAAVLRDSARFTDFLGRVEPGWIEGDQHPLATAVTRRETAMLRTSGEFRQAGELLSRGLLQ